jgi:hypothetical protein
LTTSATKALYTVGQHDAVVAGMGRKGKEEFNRRHERTYFHSAATSTEKGQEQGDNVQAKKLIFSFFGTGFLRFWSFSLALSIDCV